MLQPFLGAWIFVCTCCHTRSEGVSHPEPAGESGKLSKVLRKRSSMGFGICCSVMGKVMVRSWPPRETVLFFMIKFGLLKVKYYRSTAKDLSSIFLKYSRALNNWLLLVPMLIPSCSAISSWLKPSMAYKLNTVRYPVGSRCK